MLVLHYYIMLYMCAWERIARVCVRIHIIIAIILHTSLCSALWLSTRTQSDILLLLLLLAITLGIIYNLLLCVFTHTKKVALLFNSNKLLYEERTKYTRLSHRKACFWYCIASAMSFWEFVCFIYKKASSLAGWWSFFWGHYYHQHHKLLFVLPPPQLTSVKDVTSSSSF